MSQYISVKEAQNMSKADLQNQGAIDARSIIDDGFVDATDMIAQARKMIEYLTAYAKEIESEARAEVANSDGELKTLGAVFSLGSTGDRLNYELDEVYYRMKRAIKEREDLLKLAHNSSDDVFDGAKNKVPIVPLKSASKELLKVKL